MLSFLCGLIVLVALVSASLLPVCDPEPGTPPNAPMGIAKGIKPGRVSWMYDGRACTWNGDTSEYYWSNSNLNQKILDSMVSSTVLSVSGESKNISRAWDLIFRHFNLEHSGKDVGYQSGEPIAIKINFNDEFSYSDLSNANSVSPQFLISVIRQLVTFAGVAQNSISLVDASRVFPSYYWDDSAHVHGISAYFPNVHIVDGSGGIAYATKAVPDARTKLFFSDNEVVGQNTTRLPKTIIDAKYVLQVDAFRGHSIAGFTENGKNWFGVLYNPKQAQYGVHCGWAASPSWCPAFLHGFVNVTGIGAGSTFALWHAARPMKVYNPLVDLLGHDDLAGKVLIFFADATYGGPSQMPVPPIRFAMKPFSNDWSCSAFASLDPIAMDSVLFDFLRAEPNQPHTKKGCIDNYLHEGSMAHDPPSGTKYAPSGHALKSLGCHEHWNNAVDQEYTRNLKTGDGIELVKVHEQE